MEKGIYITQSKYIKEILETFGMKDSRPVSTPMASILKLSRNDDIAEVNQTLYRSMIGKLQYVVHNRPYIILEAGIVARFSANPKENHMMTMKRILRYLKGIEDYGLYYKKIEKFELKVYTDVDWARNMDDRKSASGGAFFLGKRLVSWTRKKHNCISQSIAKAEYVAIIINCSNLVWIKKLLKGMKEEIIDPIVIFCDNTSSINISKNPMMDTKTNHIAI